MNWLMKMFQWAEATKVHETTEQVEVEVELSPTEYIEEIIILPSHDWSDKVYE